MKRLGPELKMPALKVPPFLADLWWDLVDRRLLPLLALIVAATVAVPFLMGKSKEVPQTSLAALAAASATPTVTSGGRDLAVVQEEPGLRDYRKRLSHLRPTDPFAQRFTAPANLAHLKVTSTVSSTSPTSSPSGGAGGGGGSATATSPETAPSSGSGKAAPPTAPTKRHGIIFTFAIDVQITRAKKEPQAGEQPETWVRKRVMPLAQLPYKKQPAVTYMGLYKGKVVLLVSNSVTASSGEGKCASGEGEGTCQLIEVEPGFPETFVYGAAETEYTLKVLKAEMVILRRY